MNTTPAPTPVGAGDGAVSGKVIDAKRHEALAGATVVVIVDRREHTAITDENGRYTLVVPVGRHAVAFYYLDKQVVLKTTVTANGTTLDAAIDLSSPPP
jgi:hypothetical protein